MLVWAISILNIIRHSPGASTSYVLCVHTYKVFNKLESNGQSNWQISWKNWAYLMHVEGYHPFKLMFMLKSIYFYVTHFCAQKYTQSHLSPFHSFSYESFSPTNTSKRNIASPVRSDWEREKVVSVKDHNVTWNRDYGVFILTFLRSFYPNVDIAKKACYYNL